MVSTTTLLPLLNQKELASNVMEMRCINVNLIIRGHKVFTNKTYYFEQMFVTLFRCHHVPCFLSLCLSCFAEYTDDEAHIPKHSSVIVRRTPIGGVKPAGRTFIVYV